MATYLSNKAGKVGKAYSLSPVAVFHVLIRGTWGVVFCTFAAWETKCRDCSSVVATDFVRNTFCSLYVYV